MLQVPTQEEFDALKDAVEQIVAENTFLRSLILAQRSLTRRQVMKVLDCSDTTLWRLTKSAKLRTYVEGGTTYYDIDSVRQYLTTIKKLPRQASEQQIIKAVYKQA